MATRVLGVGNDLAADDGVGPAVLEALGRSALPPGVETATVGADALGVLAYLEEPGGVIIIDAVRMGAAPGTVVAFSAKSANTKIAANAWSLHGIGLSHALELAARLELPADVTIVGIEPESVEPGRPMSPCITRAVPAAVETVLNLLRSTDRAGPTSRPRTCD